MFQGSLILERVYLFQQGPVEFREDGARPDNVVRLRQNRVEQQEGTYISQFFCLNCVHIICCTLATYTVTRPTVARVTNRGGVGDMVSDTYDSVLFTNGESESTIWPGTHMIRIHTNIITLSR